MSYTFDFKGNTDHQLKGVEQFKRQTGGQGGNLVVNDHASYSIDSVVPVVDDIIDNNRYNYDVDPHSEAGFANK